MKVIKTSNFLNKTLLLAISCFFIINTNAIGNLSYLDILLILYILKYALSVKSFRLKKRTVKIMYVLNLFIALSVVFIPFANEKIESLLYIFQVLLAVNVIPIFLNIIQEQKLFKFFLKTVFKVLLSVSILFIVYAILHFGYGQVNWLFFTLRGNHRMVWGDGFVANDLAQFLILGFLLTEYFILDKNKGFLINVLLSLIK